MILTQLWPSFLLLNVFHNQICITNMIHKPKSITRMANNKSISLSFFQGFKYILYKIKRYLYKWQIYWNQRTWHNYPTFKWFINLLMRYLHSKQPTKLSTLSTLLRSYPNLKTRLNNHSSYINISQKTSFFLQANCLSLRLSTAHPSLFLFEFHFNYSLRMINLKMTTILQIYSCYMCKLGYF